MLPTTYPQAGLVSRENAEQLLIALEPEAASVYCRKLRLHQLMDLSSRAPGGGRLGERRSIDSSFRQGELPQGCCPGSQPTLQCQRGNEARGSTMSEMQGRESHLGQQISGREKYSPRQGDPEMGEPQQSLDLRCPTVEQRFYLA